MHEERRDRLGAASGFAAFVTGAAGGALERGWPSGNDPTAVAAFVADHRAAILWQSMLFVLSAGIYLWFLGSLRSRLARAEGGTGRISTVMFGAGTTWVALSMMAQSFQVGVAMAPNGPLPPPLLWTFAAAFGIANLPLAIMLIAFAAVSLRNGAFPKWLGWLSLVTAGAELVLWIGTVVDSGPLAPNGWLTYVLYPAFAVWLIPTTVLIMRGKARGHASKDGAADAVVPELPVSEVLAHP
jgi:hypothetical protein